MGAGWGWGVKRCAGFLFGGTRYSQQQTDLFLCLRSSFLLRFKLSELRRRDEREHNHKVRNFKAAPVKFVKGHLRQKYRVFLFFLFFFLHIPVFGLSGGVPGKQTENYFCYSECCVVFFFLFSLSFFFSASKRTTCVVCFSWSFSSFSFSSSSAASGCGKETWQENKININSAENSAFPPPVPPPPRLSSSQFIYLGKT